MERLSDIELGTVIEVTGEYALVELTVDTTRQVETGYYPGQPGSHIKIPFDHRNIIGTVVGIKASNGESDPAHARHKIARCLLIGTLLEDGRFERGVAVFPNVGHKVKFVTAEELKSIFSEFVHFDFSFGAPAQAPAERAYLHVDRFFGRHVAVLGTTGCGKSCTVASILQNTIRRYPDTHVVVLDLHGEYAAAFPNDTLLIEPDNIELPYWLLNFEEFQDLAVDQNESTAQNQLTVLKDAILRARQVTDRKKSLGLGGAVTVDSPIYFELEDMLGLIRGYNIQMLPTTEGRMEKGPMYGMFDRFMIRFESKASDPRFKFMFKPSTYTDNNSLPQLLREYLSIDTGKRMAVVDLSGVPNEAVNVVVATVARMVFEFNIWNPDRHRFPILMVFEEAHNYIPLTRQGKTTAAALAVERIAKEGRKYGVGSIIVSQRPKELSETVLAQCNTFIIMRLSNPDDQAYVRRLVPGTLSGLMDMLPSLPTGEAMIVGDSIAMPTRVMIDCPDPKPMSSDVEFSTCWRDGLKGLDVDRVVERWRSRRKDL